MTGSMKHDLFRGSSAGGSCGLVMVVVPELFLHVPFLLSCTASLAVTVHRPEWHADAWV